MLSRSFSDYGVMLEIEDVTLLSDGKSFVSTVGGRRFKVIKICEVNGTFGIFLIVRGIAGLHIDLGSE